MAVVRHEEAFTWESVLEKLQQLATGYPRLLDGSFLLENHMSETLPTSNIRTYALTGTAEINLRLVVARPLPAQPKPTGVAFDDYYFSDEDGCCQ